ncbi:MAG: HlyD family efflux transporter periplasmic adaptor subunit [Candidatus Syntrophonatronum acetioxidans]|uniref:HlyD family efflux transporter periplasmic adaptor subunit n=1 Tax=Candidatus Syntrophonatronum acetioxidans TaxID=1795816 RepID=A0A424YGM3_9FIRM|nr:MAG: HlyD family efflux transporter periplasmic adaptor subunit [Candidatus Syntrophonatronum acetioxidans]
MLASPGAYAQPGQEIITFIPQAETNYVEVQVDEDLTGQIVPGQEAVVTTNAFPEEEFLARVYRVSPGIDPDRGTFKVRLELEEFNEELVPDLAVFAEIIIGSREDSIVLQQRYLYQQEGVSFVYSIEEDRAISREVAVEEIGGGLALVKEGLEQGDIILTSLGLNEGQRVRLAGEGE